MIYSDKLHSKDIHRKLGIFFSWSSWFLGVVQHHLDRSRVIILDFLIFNLRLLQLRDVKLCFHASLWTLCGSEIDFGD